MIKPSSIKVASTSISRTAVSRKTSVEPFDQVYTAVLIAGCAVLYGGSVR